MVEHRRIAILAGATVLCLTPHPGTAENIRPGDNCELHIWPSEGLKSVLHRAADGLNVSSLGLIGTLIKKQMENSSAATPTFASPEGPLATAEQARILSSMKMGPLLGLSESSVIVHSEPLDNRILRSVKTRYVTTQTACYADLVVSDVVYSKEYANGRNLKTFFRFRDFSYGAEPVRQFGTWVQTKLIVFSPENPHPAENGLVELGNAYRANADLFSEALIRQEKHK